MKIYYAHPMSWYGTPEEAADIAAIKANWPDAEVINPAEWEPKVQAAIKRNYPVMQIFADFIRDEADLVVFRAFRDGLIGAGVAREIFEAKIWNKDLVKIMNFEGRHLHPVAASAHLPYTLTVAETKDRIKRGVL